MNTYQPSEYPSDLLKKIEKAREMIKKRKEDPKWQQLCTAVKRWSSTREGKEIAREFIQRYLAAEIAKTKIAEKNYERTR